MINQTVAGIPAELVDPPGGINIPCDLCFGAEAMWAVGVQDHRLVCDSCLNWGDSRRWWNLEPRQVI